MNFCWRHCWSLFFISYTVFHHHFPTSDISFNPIFYLLFSSGEVADAEYEDCLPCDEGCKQCKHSKQTTSSHFLSSYLFHLLHRSSCRNILQYTVATWYITMSCSQSDCCEVGCLHLQMMLPLIVVAPHSLFYKGPLLLQIYHRK